METMLMGDAEEGRDMEVARGRGEVLFEHYPGWLWCVVVKSGIIWIRNLNIAYKWGMVLHYNKTMQDAGIRKKKVIKMAGELLERAHLKRGKREQDRAFVLEGADNYVPGHT